MNTMRRKEGNDGIPYRSRNERADIPYPWIYDTWSCCWRAVCNLLGTSTNISGYTEDEENSPDVYFDLGTKILIACIIGSAQCKSTFLWIG